MSFAWPFVLLALLFVPLLVAGYLWTLRRRRRGVSYSSLALIRAAAPARTGWKRHLPFAALVGALGLLALAAARPQVSAEVPVARSSVIVALDVSGSMCATDVDPNRLAAAQDAVREFVSTQDERTQVGLVVFSGFAELAVAPTTDRQELLDAISTLTTGRGTTIGSAILKSLDAIASIDPDVPGTAGAPGAAGPPGAVPDTAPDSSPVTPPTGGYVPEIVVLLTDGANTTGTTPLAAARTAAAQGVRVYPIGFGTTNPTQMVCTADQLGGSDFDGRGFPGGGFPGGGGGRRGNFLVADEPTLRQVATLTGGQYFAARDAGQLHDVLRDLPRHVQVQHRELELSVVPAGLAAILVLLSLIAAARWTSFPN
jgi:Ca-activated chloride channel family protein